MLFSNQVSEIDIAAQAPVREGFVAVAVPFQLQVGIDMFKRGRNERVVESGAIVLRNVRGDFAATAGKRDVLVSSGLQLKGEMFDIVRR